MVIIGTLLHHATIYDNPEIVEYLLKKGIDPNITYISNYEHWNGKTAKDIAIQEQKEKIIEIFNNFTVSPLLETNNLKRENHILKLRNQSLEREMKKMKEANKNRDLLEKLEKLEEEKFILNSQKQEFAIQLQILQIKSEEDKELFYHVLKHKEKTMETLLKEKEKKNFLQKVSPSENMEIEKFFEERLNLDTCSASGSILNIFPTNGFQTNIDIHKAAAMIMIEDPSEKEAKLPSWSRDEHHRYYYQVKSHMINSTSIEDAKFKYHLSDNEVGAILYYTQSSKLYLKLNNTLANRKIPKLWKPFLWYIIEGIKKCPKVKTKVFRGLNVKVTEKSLQYKKDKYIVWVAFSSSSTKAHISTSFTKSDKYTKMEIESLNGRDISFFSLNEKEKEVIFLPNSFFLIEDVISNENEDRIILKEILDENFTYYNDEEMNLRIDEICESNQFKFD